MVWCGLCAGAGGFPQTHLCTLLYARILKYDDENVSDAGSQSEGGHPHHHLGARAKCTFASNLVLLCFDSGLFRFATNPVRLVHFLAAMTATDVPSSKSVHNLDTVTLFVDLSMDMDLCRPIPGLPESEAALQQKYAVSVIPAHCFPRSTVCR